MSDAIERIAAAPERGLSLQRSALPVERRPLTRRLLRRQGLTILLPMAALAFVVLFGEAVAPYDVQKPDYSRRLAAPSADHWFGTDELGRDLFSRVLAGARLSLGAALAAEALVVVVGTIVGLLAGYYGGIVDEVLMRITDVFLAFPAILLAMAVIAALGMGLEKTVLAVSFTWWPYYARLVRGEVLSAKARDYVLAARALGATHPRIMFVHVLRNCLTPVIVQLTIAIGAALVTISGLSFLGFGAQPPEPEWGALISSGFRYILVAPWYSTFPGVAIVVVVLIFSTAGDALQESLGKG